VRVFAACGIATNSVVRTHVVGGNVDFKPVRFYASYQYNGSNGIGSAAISRSSYSLAAQIFMTSGDSIIAQYQSSNDRSSAHADTRVFGVAYNRELSKRTGLYAAYAYRQNYNRAAFTIQDATNASVGTIAPGSNPSSFMLGIRHIF